MKPILRRRIIALLSALVVCVLGCKAVLPSAPAPVTPSAAPSITLAITLLASATPRPEATLPHTATASPPPPTETFTPRPSPTPVPPSPTALPATPTPTSLPQSLQADIFEELWTIVNNEYLYPDFNGLDWKALRKEYRQKIKDGMTNDEFYRAMDEAIARLGDDHSVFLSPEAVRAEEEEYAGNLDYVGIGVMLSAVPERNGAVVLAVFADSPAADAGLQVGDAILTVDGMPILDADGYLTSLLRGPAETPVTIALQTPGGDPRPVTVTRRRITGSMPVPYQVFASPQGLRIGYIVLITFSDSTIDEQFGDALEAMTADAPLDGLIVDNRPNSGGADTVLKGVLSYITHGEMGKFISRDQTRTLTVLRKRDIGGSQTLPLVVLVGEDTISYGEVFAGILKDINRAYLIGQTTLGNVETLWGYDFPDGSRAWIAHESFRPLNHPDENWELTGIIPNLTVPVDWSVYLTVQDPAIQAALKFFDQR